MADSAIDALHRTLEATRRSLDSFDALFAGVHYSYYHAEPPIRVPDAVWEVIAYELVSVPYESLEISKDGSACLDWSTTFVQDDKKRCVVAVKQFKLLCKECVQGLREHMDVLAVEPEILARVSPHPELKEDHFQWISLVHWLAAENITWKELVSKCLIVTQRPARETSLMPDEQEWLEGLVRELREQSEAVPELWVEEIRELGSVLRFHSQMLDVLECIVIDAHVKERVEGTIRLTDFQKNLIRALGRKTLTAARLCDTLNTMMGADYSPTGQVKGILSELVKRGCMKSDRTEGYELTDLGQRILATLTK